MKLYGVTSSTICKSFALTLSGFAQKWYKHLKLGSIALFPQFSKLFVNHFKTRKFVKKSKSHLFAVKQRQNECLKDYIAHFNADALFIERCNDYLSFRAIMVGLKPNKLLWFIDKNDLKDFQDLLSCDKKYANVEELMNFWDNEGYTKSGEKRKKAQNSSQ